MTQPNWTQIDGYFASIHNGCVSFKWGISEIKSRATRSLLFASTLAVYLTSFASTSIARAEDMTFEPEIIDRRVHKPARKKRPKAPAAVTAPVTPAVKPAEPQKTEDLTFEPEVIERSPEARSYSDFPYCSDKNETVPKNCQAAKDKDGDLCDDGKKAWDCRTLEAQKPTVQKPKDAVPAPIVKAIVPSVESVTPTTAIADAQPLAQKPSAVVATREAPHEAMTPELEATFFPTCGGRKNPNPKICKRMHEVGDSACPKGKVAWDCNIASAKSAVASSETVVTPEAMTPELEATFFPTCGGRKNPNRKICKRMHEVGASACPKGKVAWDCNIATAKPTVAPIRQNVESTTPTAAAAVQPQIASPASAEAPRAQAPPATPDAAPAPASVPAAAPPVVEATRLLPRIPESVVEKEESAFAAAAKRTAKASAKLQNRRKLPRLPDGVIPPDEPAIAAVQATVEQARPASAIATAEAVAPLPAAERAKNALIIATELAERAVARRDEAALKLRKAPAEKKAAAHARFNVTEKELSAAKKLVEDLTYLEKARTETRPPSPSSRVDVGPDKASPDEADSQSSTAAEAGVNLRLYVPTAEEWTSSFWDFRKTPVEASSTTEGVQAAIKATEEANRAPLGNGDGAQSADRRVPPVRPSAPLTTDSQESDSEGGTTATGAKP